MTPPTKEQLASKRYGQWAGNPSGYAYDPNKCAEQVYANWLPKQCSKKPVAGTDNLFCRQHAKYYLGSEVPTTQADTDTRRKP